MSLKPPTSSSKSQKPRAAVAADAAKRVAVLGAGGVDEVRTRKLLQLRADRFELAAGRLIAARGLQGERGSVVVEILSVP